MLFKKIQYNSATIKVNVTGKQLMVVRSLKQLYDL